MSNGENSVLPEEELWLENEKRAQRSRLADELRQTDEDVVFRSGDKKRDYYERRRQEAEKEAESWEKKRKGVDKWMQPSQYEMVEQHIELALEEIKKWEQKTQTYRRSASPQPSNASTAERWLEDMNKRDDEELERDVVFAIHIAMLPELECITLQEIFEGIFNRMGEPEKTAQIQPASEVDVPQPVVAKPSFINTSLGAVLRRIHAAICTKEVEGELIEVICFNEADLEIKDMIRGEYRDIIQRHIIPTIMDYICENEKTLEWKVRQLIGYAIGDFMPQATSRIFDLLTDKWASRTDRRIPATTGYPLSRAVANGLKPETLLSYLKRWIDSPDANLQWTAASVCKEIGKVDIDLALNVLQQVLWSQRSRADKSVLEAVNYSLVVLSLSGFYREVLTKLSQRADNEENAKLREIYLSLFLDLLNTFLALVRNELRLYGRKGIGNQNNTASKSIGALWRNFTQLMDDDFQTAIVDVLVRLIQLPVNPSNVQSGMVNFYILGRWLEIFSQEEESVGETLKQTEVEPEEEQEAEEHEEDAEEQKEIEVEQERDGHEEKQQKPEDIDVESAYEPDVPEIVEQLLVKVYEKLDSAETASQPSVSEVRAGSTRPRGGGMNRGRRVQLSEYQQVFWDLIKPWGNEPPGNVKQKVFSQVSKRVGMGNFHIFYSESRHRRRNGLRR